MMFSHLKDILEVKMKSGFLKLVKDVIPHNCASKFAVMDPSSVLLNQLLLKE